MREGTSLILVAFIALLALQASAAVQTSADVSTSTALITTVNTTLSRWSTIKSVCAVNGPAVPMDALHMPATWFGQTTAPHADFEVLDCGTLRLPQTNASLVVYLPPRRHPPTCQVRWSSAQGPDASNATVLNVTVTNSTNYWTVTFPADAQQPINVLCHARSSMCPLSSAPSCVSAPPRNSTSRNSSLLSKGNTSTCVAGSAFNTSQHYGLRAQFYPFAYPNCSAVGTGTTLPDFSQLTPMLSRCQDALDIQEYQDVWFGNPVLDPALFTSCYAVQLDGFVQISPPTIQWDTLNQDPTFNNRYQVCVRSSGPVRVALGGSVLEQSVPSSFNAVLLCQDVQLDHGRVPISIQWASAPNSVQTLLQLWVIPVAEVWAVTTDPAVGYGFTWACTCCSPSFNEQSGASQTCCPPLSDCSFSTDSCSASLAPRQGVPSPSKRKPASQKKPTSHKKPSPKPQHTPTAYPPCQSWAHGVASVALQSPAGSGPSGSLQFSVHASTKGKATGSFRFMAPPAVTSFTATRGTLGNFSYWLLAGGQYAVLNFAGKGVLDNLQSSEFTFNALLPVNTSGEPTITLSLVADDGSLGGSYAGTVTKGSIKASSPQACAKPSPSPPPPPPGSPSPPPPPPPSPSPPSAARVVSPAPPTSSAPSPSPPSQPTQTPSPPSPLRSASSPMMPLLAPLMPPPPFPPATSPPSPAVMLPPPLSPAPSPPSPAPMTTLSPPMPPTPLSPAPSPPPPAPLPTIPSAMPPSPIPPSPASPTPPAAVLNPSPAMLPGVHTGAPDVRPAPPLSPSPTPPSPVMAFPPMPAATQAPLPSLPSPPPLAPRSAVPMPPPATTVPSAQPSPMAMPPAPSSTAPGHPAPVTTSRPAMPPAPAPTLQSPPVPAYPGGLPASRPGYGHLPTPPPTPNYLSAWPSPAQTPVMTPGYSPPTAAAPAGPSPAMPPAYTPIPGYSPSAPMPAPKPGNPRAGTPAPGRSPAVPSPVAATPSSSPPPAIPMPASGLTTPPTPAVTPGYSPTVPTPSPSTASPPTLTPTPGYSPAIPTPGPKPGNPRGGTPTPGYPPAVPTPMAANPGYSPSPAIPTPAPGPMIPPTFSPTPGYSSMPTSSPTPGYSPPSAVPATTPTKSPPPAASTPAAAPPVPSPSTTPVPTAGVPPSPTAMSPPEPESPPPPPLFGTPPSPPSYPPPPAAIVPRTACQPSAVGAGVIALPSEGFATFRLEVTEKMTSYGERGAQNSRPGYSMPTHGAHNLPQTILTGTLAFDSPPLVSGLRSYPGTLSHFSFQPGSGEYSPGLLTFDGSARDDGGTVFKFRFLALIPAVSASSTIRDYAGIRLWNARTGELVGSSMGFIQEGSITATSGTSGSCSGGYPPGSEEGRAGYPGYGPPIYGYAPVAVPAYYYPPVAAAPPPPPSSLCPAPAAYSVTYFVEPSCSGRAERTTYAPAMRIVYGQYSYGQYGGQYGGYKG